MLPHFRVCLLTASLLASLPIGCAQISNKLPRVSLKPSADKTTQFSVARLYEKQNRLGAARKMYTELHTKSPQDLQVLHRLAAISTRLGDFDSANKYYEKSLAIDPDNSVILADYGYAQYLQGNMEAAEETLNRSLTLNPDNRHAVGNLALLAGMNGRFEEALTLYRSVVGEAEAQANLGYIHVQRGEGELAISRYDRALTLDEDLTSAANALIKLAALRDNNSNTKNTSDILQIADKPREVDESVAKKTEELIRGQSEFAAIASGRDTIGRSTINSPRQLESPPVTKDVPTVPAAKLKEATVDFSIR